MKNPELTRQYVKEAILPIQDMLESMDEKINILLPKRNLVINCKDHLYLLVEKHFL